MLARAGAAVSLPQDAALAEALAAELRRLLEGKDAAPAMTAAYDRAGVPDPRGAASALADLMEGKNSRG